MSKKKIRTTSKSSAAIKDTTASSSKTLSLPTGINSMINWLAGLLLIISFIYSTTPMDPALAPRYIFLSGFILLFILYFFAWRKRVVSTPSFLIRLIFITGAAFALWNLLGLFGAINYHEGYYEISRYLLDLILFFIVIQAVIQEPAAVKNIFYILTIIALLHSLVGILQFYEIAFTEIPGNYKPYGFMANRNLFGSAQALLLPFAIYTFYAANRSWKIISVVAITGIFVSLVLSLTRASWLSEIAVLLVAAILVLIFVPTMRKKWMLGTLAAAVVIALMVAILILPNKDNELARSVTERASSLATNTSSNTIAGSNITERLKIWKRTVKMIGDHPLLGVGAGNWKIVMPSYGLDSTVFAKGFYAPDRVHNVYLQVASETGIPGTVFYFGFWLIIVWAGFSFLRKTNNENKKIMVILMLAGLSAVAVDAMFSFANERIEHSIYMMAMGGIIVGLYAQEIVGTGYKIVTPKRILMISMVVVAAFNLFLGIKKFDFEKHLVAAVYYNDHQQFSQTLDEVKQGTNEFFTMDLTANPLEMYSGIAYKELKNFDAATRDFKKAVSYSPYNCRIYNNRAILNWELKQLQNSVNDYNTALKYAPEFETVFKNLAFTYYQAGQYKECIENINRIKEKDEMTINVLNDAKKKLEEVK